MLPQETTQPSSRSSPTRGAAVILARRATISNPTRVRYDVRCDRPRRKPMAAQARYIFIASMDVDPAKEDVFNEVYDTEHVPFLLKVPGVLSARRYKSEPLTMFIAGKQQTIAAEGEPRY